MKGRWTSRDPIAEYGGSGLFMAVLNCPANWIDVLGLDPWHHVIPPGVFPEQYMKDIGLDIDLDDAANGIDLPKEIHEDIHSNKNKNGKTWNAAWEDWRDEFRDKGAQPTKDDFEKKTKELIGEYELDKYPKSKGRYEGKKWTKRGKGFLKQLNEWKKAGKKLCPSVLLTAINLVSMGSEEKRKELGDLKYAIEQYAADPSDPTAKLEVSMLINEVFGTDVGQAYGALEFVECCDDEISYDSILDE